MARTPATVEYLKNNGKSQRVDRNSQSLNWRVFKMMDTETYYGESVRVTRELGAG